jgi:hypothetical protein
VHFCALEQPRLGKSSTHLPKIHSVALTINTMSSVLPVRSVVVLKGEKNLKKWKCNFFKHLELQRLNEFVLDGVDPPNEKDKEAYFKWYEKRLKVRLIIVDFIQPIHETLENYGWNRERNRDPKAFYDLILQYIPKASEDIIKDFVIEWNALKSKSTLKNYLRKAIILRRRFRQLGITFLSSYEILCLMAPLKKVNETFHSQF